jgi:hypothetical protein
MTNSPAEELAIVLAGMFLLVGMLTGVWKYRQMMARADNEADMYVNVAHQASLLYSPAVLVLGALAWLSPLPEAVDKAALLSVTLYFAIAVGTYLLLGLKGASQTQFHERNAMTTIGMWSLIVVEIGGTLVLVAGAVSGVLG